MEDQCNWAYYHQEKGMEEFRHSLLYTTLGLETAILSAQDEITRKEDELIHLKGLLTRTIKERDEAQAKCQKLLLEKLILQQQQQQLLQQQQVAPIAGVSSNEEESRGGDSNTGFSDCDESNISSSSLGADTIPRPPLPPLLQQAAEKPLPEKGKLLQAVMEAGPLLQTLLLAGPLPQWQHPPPQLDSIEIPPVAIHSPTPLLLHQDPINGCFSKKRGLVPCEANDSPPNTKYQRFVHH